MKDAANSWREIEADLLARINARDWAPGDALPTEAELAADYGCARATVNRAMRELAEQGIITRKRRAGSRVALHPVSRVVFRVPMVREEVARQGGTWDQSVIGRETARAPVPVLGRMGLPNGTPLLHVRTLHLSDGHPFLYEDRWINPAAAPGAATADFALLSANEWLLRHVPYTRGDVSFLAVNADAMLADCLGTTAGQALFVMDRTTWNGDQPVTHVRNVYPPGYRMQADG